MLFNIILLTKVKLNKVFCLFPNHYLNRRVEAKNSFKNQVYVVSVLGRENQHVLHVDSFYCSFPISFERLSLETWWNEGSLRLHTLNPHIFYSKIPVSSLHTNAVRVISHPQLWIFHFLDIRRLIQYWIQLTVLSIILLALHSLI